MSVAKELLEQYEYSLPLIKSDKVKIRFEAARDTRGEFTLQNAGGGTLEGNIDSNFSGLSFSPARFTGNKVKVEYKFSLGTYEPGDVIDTRIIIMSNGGELIIPVHITVISRALTTDDGTVLSMLDDFLAYTESNASEAARTFARKDFGEWLASMPGNPNTELYEHLKFDPNKERAADNFLVCHGLKEKPVIYLESRTSDVAISPGQKELLNGFINVKRTSGGYCEANISAAGPHPWLRLITTKLTNASFDKNNNACIDYIINPAHMTNRRAMVKINVKTADSTEQHTLLVNTLPLMGVTPNKNAYTLTDGGRLLVENNTGADLKVEIVPRHDFIRFEGRYYLIGAKADIPFTINLTNQKFALAAEKDAVIARSEILVKTVHEGHLFVRNVAVFISMYRGFS